MHSIASSTTSDNLRQRATLGTDGPRTGVAFRHGALLAERIDSEAHRLRCRGQRARSLIPPKRSAGGYRGVSRSQQKEKSTSDRNQTLETGYDILRHLGNY